MTRDFEKEYRQYADSSVPDLWGRIEASIDEKEKNTKKTSTVTYIRKYSPFIAAAACVLLTIGAVRFINRPKNTASEAAATAPMESAASAMESAAPEMESAAPATEEAAPAKDSADSFAAEAEMNEAAAETSGSYDMAAEAEYEGPAYESSEAPSESSLGAGASDDFAVNSEEAAEMVSEAEASEEPAESAISGGSEKDRNKQGLKYDDDISGLSSFSITAIICTVDKLPSSASKTGTQNFTVKVADALESDFDKGQILKVSAEPDVYKTVKDLSGAEGKKEFIILLADDGSNGYTVLAADEK
ncbi:MAG: hypothetical protein K6G58_03860 [Lachnospiraceae bacterium]|nr:hypothetical protein [Lachnospiraceae bacterium]